MAADQATGEDARVARTRADVARAAFEVLTTEGSDALTHARVADLAGYSKTTLYAHWPSRVDLIAMAIEALGDMPHHDRTGDLRADVIAELQVFRDARSSSSTGPHSGGHGPVGIDRSDGAGQGQGQHRRTAPDVRHARRTLRRRQNSTLRCRCWPA